MMIRNKTLNLIVANLDFYLLLAFLFCIPFSIAACYIFSSILFIRFLFQLTRGAKWPKLPRFFYYFLVFAFFTIVSCIFSVDTINSIKDSKELFIFLLFPLYFTILNSEKRIRISLFTVLTSQVISSFIGLFQAITIGITLDNRIRGLTSHWMTYSGLIMLVIIFYFIFGYFRPKWSEKSLYWLPLLPALAALAVSLTRAMWVGLAVAIFAFFIKVKPKLIFFAIPIIAALLLFSPQSVKNRLFSIFDLKNETNQDRIYMSYAAGKIFLDHPITGVGLDNIKKIYPAYKHPNATIMNMHLHNNFLQILAERGILALISLIVAFFILLKELWRQQNKKSEPFNLYARAVFFVIIGFLMAGMFEYNFGHSQVKFLLFYFMSLPFLNIKESDDIESKKLTGNNR